MIMLTVSIISRRLCFSRSHFFGMNFLLTHTKYETKTDRRSEHVETTTRTVRCVRKWTRLAVYGLPCIRMAGIQNACLCTQHEDGQNKANTDTTKHYSWYNVMSPKTKKQRKEAKRGTKNEQQLTAVTHKDGAPHTIICSYFSFWLFGSSLRRSHTQTTSTLYMHGFVFVCIIV